MCDCPETGTWWAKAGSQPERGVALGTAGQTEPPPSENQELQQERGHAAGFHRPCLPAPGPNLIPTHTGNTRAAKCPKIWLAVVQYVVSYPKVYWLRSAQTGEARTNDFDAGFYQWVAQFLRNFVKEQEINHKKRKMRNILTKTIFLASVTTLLMLFPQANNPAATNPNPSPVSECVPS